MKALQIIDEVLERMQRLDDKRQAGKLRHAVLLRRGVKKAKCDRRSRRRRHDKPNPLKVGSHTYVASARIVTPKEAHLFRGMCYMADMDHEQQRRGFFDIFR